MTTEIKNSPSKTGKPENKLASTKALDFIISGVLYLIFFLTPIYFVGLTAQGIGFEKIVLFYFLVLLGIVAWVTKGVITGELSLKRTPLDLPIVLTVIAFAISTILSVSAKDSLIGSYGNSVKGLAAVIVFALFYYLVVNNINISRIKAIFSLLVFSSSLVVIYSALQLRGIFLLPMTFTHNASFNPIGSLSGLTMFLVIILPMLVILFSQIKEIFPKLNKIFTLLVKLFIGVVTLGALAILALLNGFTFWPVAIVGIVIVLMFFLSKIIKISNNNLLFPLFIFLCLIILLVLGNFNILNMNLPSEVSLSRNASWDIAKSSIRENPVFGSGPSTFYYDFSKFKSIDFNSSPLWNIRFDSATGAVFGLLATVGIFGTLSIIILALIALSISFLTLIKVDNREINSVLLALFASFISAMLFSILFSQNNPLILIIIIISIFTVSATLVMYPEKFKTLRLSFRSSAKYALALAAVFLCVSAGVVVLFTMGLKMYLGDMYVREALMAQTEIEKIEKLSKAVTLAPYQDSYYLTLANSYMTLANQGAAAKADQAEIRDNLGKAIASGKKATEISPEKVSNNEALALIYENASFYTRDALKWAEDYYNKVAELDPNNPTPHLRIALINMARANAESDTGEKEYYISEAINKYEDAIKKKSDSAAAYYGKAIAYEKLNNLDDAIEQLKNADLVAGNNLDYRFELGRLYFNRGVTQLNLGQTASKEIAETEILPDGEEGATSTEEISVKPTQPTGSVVARNNDLNLAEQYFLSILVSSPNHANARYSLAVLYQKIGEDDKAETMVNSLLEIITDEQTKETVRSQFKDIL